MKNPPAARFELTIQQGATAKASGAERPSFAVDPEVPKSIDLSARPVVEALQRSAGAETLGTNSAWATAFNWDEWFPTAIFTVSQKFGTARYLDLWNCDHFDDATDMQKNLSEDRAWFSDNGYDSWGSPESSDGVINCHFRAPTDGRYVCDVRLLSHQGPAEVECLIDGNSFGPLPLDGSLLQPHPCELTTGNHDFQIRQTFGAFFFVSLFVWRVGDL